MSLVAVTYNVSGLAAALEIEMLSPKHQPNNELKFKNMNKKLNSVPSARTKDEQRTTADFSTSASVEANPMLSVRHG